MLTVSLQQIQGSDVRTLLAVREERIVRDVVRLIAERLPKLTEQEPPEWLRFVGAQEVDEDVDRE